MLNLIKATDILSPIPELKINRKTRYQTVLGGVFSILTFVMILVTTGYFLNILFSRLDKTITYNIGPPKTNITQDMNKSPYAVLVVDRYGFPFANSSRIYSLRTIRWQLYMTANGLMTVPFPIQNEMCNITKHFSGFVDLVSNVPFMNIHNCPKPNQNLNIFGTFGEATGFSFLVHYVYKCQNDTKVGKTDCYDEKTIDTYLNFAYVHYKGIDFTLNHSNIDNPGQPYLRSDPLSISSSVYRRQFYTFRSVEYISDIGYIFESKVTQNYYTYTDAKESTDLSNLNSSTGGLIAFVQFSMDPKMDYYSRNFLKAQTVLANVGGIIKALIVASQICTVIFNTELYYYELIQSLFKISNEKLEKESTKNKIQMRKSVFIGVNLINFRKMLLKNLTMKRKI